MLYCDSWLARNQPAAFSASRLLFAVPSVFFDRNSLSLLVPDALNV